MLRKDFTMMYCFILTFGCLSSQYDVRRYSSVLSNCSQKILLCQCNTNPEEPVSSLISLDDEEEPCGVEKIREKLSSSRAFLDY